MLDALRLRRDGVVELLVVPPGQAPLIHSSPQATTQLQLHPQPLHPQQLLLPPPQATAGPGVPLLPSPASGQGGGGRGVLGAEAGWAVGRRVTVGEEAEEVQESASVPTEVGHSRGSGRRWGGRGGWRGGRGGGGSGGSPDRRQAGYGRRGGRGGWRGRGRGRRRLYDDYEDYDSEAYDSEMYDSDAEMEEAGEEGYRGEYDAAESDAESPGGRRLRGRGRRRWAGSALAGGRRGGGGGDAFADVEEEEVEEQEEEQQQGLDTDPWVSGPPPHKRQRMDRFAVGDARARLGQGVAREQLGAWGPQEEGSGPEEGGRGKTAEEQGGHGRLDWLAEAAAAVATEGQPEQQQEQEQQLPAHEEAEAGGEGVRAGVRSANGAPDWRGVLRQLLSAQQMSLSLDVDSKDRPQQQQQQQQQQPKPSDGGVLQDSAGQVAPEGAASAGRQIAQGLTTEGLLREAPAPGADADTGAQGSDQRQQQQQPGRQQLQLLQDSSSVVSELVAAAANAAAAGGGADAAWSDMAAALPTPVLEALAAAAAAAVAAASEPMEADGTSQPDGASGDAGGEGGRVEEGQSEGERERVKGKGLLAATWRALAHVPTTQLAATRALEWSRQQQQPQQQPEVPGAQHGEEGDGQLLTTSPKAASTPGSPAYHATLSSLRGCLGDILRLLLRAREVATAVKDKKPAERGAEDGAAAAGPDVEREGGSGEAKRVVGGGEVAEGCLLAAAPLLLRAARKLVEWYALLAVVAAAGEGGEAVGQLGVAAGEVRERLQAVLGPLLVPVGREEGSTGRNGGVGDGRGEKGAEVGDGGK